MSINKKVVWLPYDMDTALGINNEGELVFDYRLEDTDHLPGGAEVYNGQDSVVWNNIRLAFADELRSMYQTLRSQGKLSYEAIEQAFERHQAKWPEALFNEDSQFCYIDPLINDGTNYLAMLQGSKAEQRKWWMYNRFRYIDSKYNAGDAASDLIQLRSYAKSNITITPYADVYPTVKFGSYLVQARGQRNVPTTLVCPVDRLNDTETYIYSASQLASVGDLSGLKVGFADFSKATKLQSLKLGDSSQNYENQNLKTLTLGNNVLLQTIDVRNCTALGSGNTKVVDISGCTGIQKAWFDNTQISALTLPIGGVLDELSLPSTVSNLTIRNQPKLTTFSIEDNDYSSIQTCRIENTDYFLQNQTWFNQIMRAQSAGGLKDGCRLRLVGIDIDWLADTAAIETFYTTLGSRFRGLKIDGDNQDDPYLQGVIHVSSASGSAIAALTAIQPYVTIDAESISSTVTYKTYDGSSTITTETVLKNDQNPHPNAIYSGHPSRTSTAQYDYTFAGWSTSPNGAAEATAQQDIQGDRTLYAAYTSTVRTYTVYWVNNGTTIETDTNVPYGATPSYNGATPTKDGQTSLGWSPDPTQPITGNTTFTAQYLPVYTVTFKNETGTTTLQTKDVVQGQSATYTGTIPVCSEDATLAFLGWSVSMNSNTVDAVLTNIQSNMIVYAAFESAVEVKEITDSWDTIIANIDNGTYSSVYKIGNYKPLDLGTEGTINMQIVAMDADELANGTGYAPLTFVGMELLSNKRAMNTTYTSTGGWGNSGMRSWLLSSILPTITSTVKSRIQIVNKSYYVKQTKSTEICADKLWLPSIRELKGSTYIETSGIIYANIYKDTTSRVKTRNGTPELYWTRSCSDNNNGIFYFVSSSGDKNDNSSGRADASNGVALGFCLGLEPETITDSWSTIVNNLNYASDYSIGDTKYLDLGTEGKHLMEIVAFDTDDRADNTGKAGITWISKTLLNTPQKMNNTATTTGGWASSEMRNYLKNTIKPLIPLTVRNAIVEVSKVSSTYENNALVKNGQTTTDDVWIPSNYEIYPSSVYIITEDTGAAYTAFDSVISRSKRRLGESSNGSWWERSVDSNGKFTYIGPSSLGSSAWASTAYYIALGFCTNEENTVKEISDSWDTIIANIDNGTYSSVYKIGNYKPLDLGTEGIVNMQIVAMDTDTLADNSGTAPLTFISMETLQNYKKMLLSQYWDDTWASQPTNTNEDRYLRAWLHVTLPTLITQNIKNRVKEVIKTSLTNGSQNTNEVSSTDKYWVPSLRELNTKCDNRQESGISYSLVFRGTTQRTVGYGYWLRSRRDTNRYYVINNAGSEVYVYSDGYQYVRFGFCLGLAPTNN